MSRKISTECTALADGDGSAENAELRTARDVELLEDVREVGLDRPLGHVELLGDLAVGEPVGGQQGDAVLGRCERLDAGQRGAAGPRAGALQLVPGTAGEQAHAAAVGELECPAERLAGVASAIGAPQRGAEVDERARVLEPVGRGLEQGAGLL